MDENEKKWYKYDCHNPNIALSQKMAISDFHSYNLCTKAFLCDISVYSTYLIKFRLALNLFKQAQIQTIKVLNPYIIHEKHM